MPEMEIGEKKIEPRITISFLSTFDGRGRDVGHHLGSFLLFRCEFPQTLREEVLVVDGDSEFTGKQVPLGSLAGPNLKSQII